MIGILVFLLPIIRLRRMRFVQMYTGRFVATRTLDHSTSKKEEKQTILRDSEVNQRLIGESRILGFRVLLDFGNAIA